jgi:hypothetical protein
MPTQPTLGEEFATPVYVARLPIINLQKSTIFHPFSQHLAEYSFDDQRPKDFNNQNQSRLVYLPDSPNV